MNLFRLNNGSWTDDVLPLCHFETVNDVNDDDSKTLPKEDIPKGTHLEDVKVFLNCYGTYVSCRYKGKHYNVNAALVKVIPTAEAEALIQPLEVAEEMPNGHVDGRRGACMTAEHILDENIRGFAHAVRWADVRGQTVDYDDKDIAISVHVNNHSLPNWIKDDDVVNKEIAPEAFVDEINQHLNTFIPTLAHDEEKRLTHAILARFQHRAHTYLKNDLLCIRQGDFSLSLYSRKIIK